MTSVILLPLCFVGAFAIGLSGFGFSAFFKRMSVSDAVAAVAGFFRCMSTADGDALRDCRGRQLNVIISVANVVSLVNVFNVIVVAWLLMRTSGDYTVYMWASVIALMSVFHSTEAVDLITRGLASKNPRKRLFCTVRNVTLFGLVWGSAGFLFIDDLTSVKSLIVMIALMGTAAGGAAAMAVVPQASIMFVTTIAAPTFYRLLSSGGEEYMVLAAFEASFVFTLGAISFAVFDVLIKSAAADNAAQGASGSPAQDCPIVRPARP